MVLKCKMCGGDIKPIENTNTGKCLYCKSVMTLPNLNDEKIINLYNRANSLRLANEFDKSSGVYETILELDNSQIEAHWGLVLCKYGVEYVDDPKTKKKIPTCHRTCPESVLDTPDYKYIIANSYGDALELYQKEAKQINEIEKKILEISRQEEPYDIFICYKETDENGERTLDSVLSQNIYKELTNLNYKVFFSKITLEDKLGTEYEPYIYNALTSAKVMLVVGTSPDHLDSVWVKNEWSRYLELTKKDPTKTLIPVYSKMDAYELPASFSMLQSQNLDKVGAMQDLIRGIEKLINEKKVTSKDINEEMFLRFKKMLEEEKNAQHEETETEELFETPCLKITASKLFILISFLLSVAMAVWMFLAACGVHFLINAEGSYRITGYLNILYSKTSLHFLVAILTFIAFFLGFASKKTFKISKVLYLLNIIIELGYIFDIYTIGYKPNNLFLTIFLLNYILLIIKPKWSLKSNTIMLNKEMHQEQLEINKKNEALFSEKKPEKIYLGSVIIGLICIFIVLGFAFTPLKSQSNARDSSVIQVKVNGNYINIRSKASINSPKIGIVYRNEIYTVLDHTENSNWLKIKTNYGLTGYINKEYIEILPTNE